MKPASVVVRYRTATVTVYPVERGSGRTYWRFCKGRRLVTRATLEKAKKEALAYAESSFLSAAKLPLLDGPKVRAIQRMLDADPTLSLVEDFLHWHAHQRPRYQLDAARREFLAVKRANAGTSPHHVRTLERHLACLPDLVLAEIGLSDLPAVTGAPRSRKNRIGAWRQFFTWCCGRGYLPDGNTVADRLDVPAIPRTTPETWTPDELRILIANVTPEYLPWLLLSAWAGMRTEEICPDPKSKKSPLLWSDFQWDRGLIIVRPETAKTGQRRVIPIPACLAASLPRDRVGRVGPALPPHTPRRGHIPGGKRMIGRRMRAIKEKAGELAETTRLGKFVGGWRRNALRHSFLSYRAAKVGIAQAAREAGNSESIARRVYEDAKGVDEAEKWFSVPSEPSQQSSQSATAAP